MASASTAARAMGSLVFLLLAVSMVSAGSVEPSNATLPTSESASEFVMSFSGGPLSSTYVPATYRIAPLTKEVGLGDVGGAATIVVMGHLQQIGASNMNANVDGNIAYISCDSSRSNIDPSMIVNTVGNANPKPRSILLYSLTAQECNLTETFSYTSIFTTTSLNDSVSLINYLANYPSMTDLATARLAVNSTTANANSSPSSTPGGPAPTTAVAMSVLYSITGIITLLFLVIIATGAVRAHRHPERYGPRTAVSGRSRQSRAKGLARAMLETLPIVKFGDPETTAKPSSPDVELGETHMATETTRDVTTSSGGNGEHDAAAKPHTAEATVVESGLASGEEAVHSKDHDDHDGHDHDKHDHNQKEAAAEADEDGHLGCSICTDDFCTGEDVRVLPCNHKFHPACVDPWLLNVSGTCPLCRHDLRPAPVEEPSENAEGQVDAAAGELPPPLVMSEETSSVNENENEAGSSQHRSRAARLLDIHRLRHAPADERIAALRQLREQTQNEGEAVEGEADVEEPSRRLRLTGRLKDAFKIKTRTQDTPPAH